MERHKEIGYDLIDVIWKKLPNFDKLWNATNTDIKDDIVNSIGKLSQSIAKADNESENDKKIRNFIKNY